MPDYTVISAPSPLGLWPSGVQLLAATLREHGIVERLGAEDGGVVIPPVYLRERDAAGFLNGAAIRDYALALAARVGPVWDAGRVPVVLGGDCSILLGPLVASRGRGRAGLVYLDGHADYYGPWGSETGEVADMGLAIATGASDALLSGIGEAGPYVAPGDAVAFGFRDEAEMVASGSLPIRESGIGVFDLPLIRQIGIAAALEQALASLAGVERVFVHFDTDALDDAVNPAVDYRQPGGLSVDEVVQVLRAVRGTGRFAGLTVSIFNPRLDPDGRVAMLLTDCLVAGLRG